MAFPATGSDEGAALSWFNLSRSSSFSSRIARQAAKSASVRPLRSRTSVSSMALLQGAKALVQHSGALEWEKIETKGKWSDVEFSITVSLKRRGQEQQYVRSFSKQDAIGGWNSMARD